MGRPTCPLGNTCCSGVPMIIRATSPGPIPGEPPPAAPHPDPREPEPAAPVQEPPVHPRDPNDPPAPEQPQPPAPDDPGAPDESIPEGPDPSPLGTARVAIGLAPLCKGCTLVDGAPKRQNSNHCQLLRPVQLQSGATSASPASSTTTAFTVRARERTTRAATATRSASQGAVRATCFPAHALRARQAPSV
jgi:hypothetical protein